MTKYFSETDRIKTHIEKILKRSFDIIVSAMLIILLSPLLLLFSLLILIFSGRPIIFKQIRTGKNYKPFVIWKFRTMEPSDANVNHHKYDWRNGVPNDFMFRTPSTQKITNIGHVYRKLSIDELPQLLNVLKGEMSFVGPRPEIPEITKLYNNYQARRLSVKPGLTGYAQLYGRSINSHGQKIEYDLQYLEKQSLYTDIKIIVLTINHVIHRKGAW